MIIRRYDRATGAEHDPVTVKQAANTIARASFRRPRRTDIEAIILELEAGQQHRTAGYVYVPDADPAVADEGVA
jgi:hypothetical protein